MRMLRGIFLRFIHTFIDRRYSSSCEIVSGHKIPAVRCHACASPTAATVGTSHQYLACTFLPNSVKQHMSHVSPAALWTHGCRAHALSDVEMEHVMICVECDRLLDEIEDALNEIAGPADQTIN